MENLLNITPTDVEILRLKQIIAEKRKNLKDVTFKPKTNCQLNLFGKYNILVLSIGEIELNITLLNVLKRENPNLKINGFDLIDWISDLEGLKAKSQYKDEVELINTLEKRLNSRLSNQFTTAKEIDEIANLLK